jgi:hypothetical protein
MSAFEALRNIRIYRLRHQELSNLDLIALIEKLVGGLDYAAGLCLDGLVGGSAEPSNPDSFYRICIDSIIHQQPVWIKTVTLGRRKFAQKLSRDQEQCFRAAGLLEETITVEVMEWWDATAARMRHIRDFEVMKRARSAEKLSLEHEIERLRQLNIPNEPIWMSLEDNTVGYDILSYDLGQVEPITRLIEVKSTVISPLRFFLSRNEWETAVKFGERYFFHVWDLRVPQLYECTVKSISDKIPSDNASGRWSSAEIPLG